jgi:hypothetical protein
LFKGDIPQPSAKTAFITRPCRQPKSANPQDKSDFSDPGADQSLTAMFVSVLDEDVSLMEIGVGNEIDQIRADMPSARKGHFLVISTDQPVTVRDTGE